MTRTATGLSMAAAFLAAATLGAQTTSTPPPTSQSQSSMHDRSDNSDVTVTGCLQKGADGNYILTNATMGADTSTTSGTTGTTGETSGATSTSSARSSSGTMAASATTWRLSGGKDLDKHVGHKIQVTGKTTWDPAMSHTSAASPDPSTTAGGATTTAGTSGSRGMQPHLDVQSIKMISTSCS